MNDKLRGRLSDELISEMKHGTKTKRATDGLGMYLELSPSGGKWWRFKYRFMGRCQTISLGTYPDTSLDEAREKLKMGRLLLSSGINPAKAKKQNKYILTDMQ